MTIFTQYLMLHVVFELWNMIIIRNITEKVLNRFQSLFNTVQGDTDKVQGVPDDV